MSEPTTTPSTRNSTKVTEPLSVAVALIVTTSPVIKPSPLEGEVIETFGAGLAATVMFTRELEVDPWSSVAVAVIAKFPAALAG